MASEETVETVESQLKKARLQHAFEGHQVSANRVAMRGINQQVLMPWERAKKAFDMPALASPFAGGGHLISAGSQEVAKVSPKPSPAASHEVFRLSGVKVPAAQGLSWDKKLSESREAALAKWIGILRRFPLDFQLAGSVEQDKQLGRAADLRASLLDVFSQKASSTMSGRVGPLARYIKRCLSRQEEPFPMSEAKAYAFLQDYAVHEAPTFARSFLSSLAFAKYTVGLRMSDEVFSPRVKGLSAKLYLDKRKTRQRPPLTVEQVKKLEDIASGASGFGDADRVAAGFFLWALYARARYSDAQGAGSLICDLADTPDGRVGYIEAAVERSKTSFSLERKVRHLHMFAPIEGVGETAWGESWFRHLEERGPPLGKGKPLLPSPVIGGGWQSAPLDVGSAAKWLKALLCKAGCDRGSVEALGSHSLKATTLSWCAKFGLSRQVRASLGYHAKGREGTELIYGRDNMAGPVRELQGVLLQISLAKFRPDSTRSGYFVKSADKPAEPIPDDELSSESSSEATEDAEDVDHEAEDGAADELGCPWEPEPGLRADLQGVPIFRHRDSRFLHAAASEEGDRFRCGRAISTRYTRLAGVPQILHPFCRGCCPTKK